MKIKNGKIAMKIYKLPRSKAHSAPSFSMSPDHVVFSFVEPQELLSHTIQHIYEQSYPDDPPRARAAHQLLPLKTLAFLFPVTTKWTVHSSCISTGTEVPCLNCIRHCYLIFKHSMNLFLWSIFVAIFDST